MTQAAGKQIPVAIGDSREFGPFIVVFESFTGGKINLRVTSKDGGVPWETDPPPNFKYLTSKPSKQNVAS